MVHILLPIQIVMGPLESSVEVLGKSASFTETPLQIQTTLQNSIQIFQSIFQYREGQPQDTVDVGILDRSLLSTTLLNVFQYNAFLTNTSVEQILVNHLSELLIGSLTMVLGLNAARSIVLITPSQQLYSGMVESIIQVLEASSDLRQLLYEQFWLESPDRFLPGKNETYQPIPFQSGDSLAFYLQLNFANAKINGNSNMPLTKFLRSSEIPQLRFIIILNFES
jgi:hypothetical protein